MGGMRWGILVLGIVAGCYAPTTQPGRPCGAEGACPGGQTCVAGVCRLDGDPGATDGGPGDTIADVDAAPDAPAPDGPPTDLDADGIANTVDNCPAMANADQHDEDDDTVGDVCDNCPHVANTLQANVLEGPGNADGVGDACDPRPTTPGDTILRFIPFKSIPTDLLLTGSWSISGDSIVKSGTAEASLTVPGVRTRVTVEAAGAQITSLPVFSALGVSVGGAGNAWHACGYYDETDPAGTDTDFHNAMIGYDDGSDFSFLFAENHFLPQRLMGDFTIRVLADAGPKRTTCTTIDARGTASTGARSTPELVPGAVGIRSEGMGYRLDYLIVFGES